MGMDIVGNYGYGYVGNYLSNKQKFSDKQTFLTHVMRIRGKMDDAQ